MKVEKKKKILRSYLINSLVILAVTILLGYFGSSTVSVSRTIIIAGCINAIAAISLNLVSGCLGEMVLGHGGFMLIGAYSAAIFIRYFKLPGELMVQYVPTFNGYLQMALALLVAFIITGLIAMIVGIPILRLKGDYLAIVTLGFTLIVYSIACNMNIGEKGDGLGVFIGGSNGASGIQAIITTNSYFALGTFVCCLAILFLYMKTRFGRTILAIRDDHVAAAAVGINVKKVRFTTFILSSAFAGVAGALSAFYVQPIPASFQIDRSIEVLIIVVLGGLGSFTGSVVGAVFIAALPILLAGFSAYQKLIYAVILLFVMLLKPTGLFGVKEFSWKGLLGGCKAIIYYIRHPKLFIKKFCEKCGGLKTKILAKFKQKTKVKFEKKRGVTDE